MPSAHDQERQEPEPSAPRWHRPTKVAMLQLLATTAHTLEGVQGGAMSRYAQGTTVSVDRSVAEIERMMERFGVNMDTDYTQVKTRGQYQCFWKIDGVTFTAQIDTSDAPDDKEVRRMWRVLVQHIKAQLISVEEGWSDAKLALAPFLMLSDGTMAKDEAIKHLTVGLELHRP